MLPDVYCTATHWKLLLFVAIILVLFENVREKQIRIAFVSKTSKYNKIYCKNTTIKGQNSRVYCNETLRN